MKFQGFSGGGGAFGPNDNGSGGGFSSGVRICITVSVFCVSLKNATHF